MQVFENLATYFKGQFFPGAGDALGLILLLCGYDIVMVVTNQYASVIATVEPVTAFGAAVSSIIASVKSTVARI